jgi:hypothetical protein
MKNRTLNLWVNGSVRALTALAAVLSLLATTGIQTALAASMTVTTTADTIDAAAGNCAGITIASLPGPDGQTSLREAVCAANNTAGADTINLPAGTYTLTRIGQSEDLAATGDLDINDSLAINGAGAASTIIDGNNTDAVFDTYNALSSTTINMSNLTIQHGNPTGSAFEGGGGIYVKNTVTMSLDHVNVLNNTANTSGGGIWNEGSLTISNSTVSGNQANGEGGGIRNAGTPVASLTITNSTISNNTAEFGGGIHDSTDGGVNLTITGSTISGNQAVDRPGGPVGDFGDGGGIHVNTDGGVNITKSTISGNTAARNGGGIYFADDPASGSPVAALTMSYNRLVGNTAVIGSGLFRSSGTATAEKNWWGCNSGPSAGPCNTVAGSVDFTPWIVLTHTASPNTILTGQASTLTAGFLKNSDGSANVAGDLGALAGVPIAFGSPVLGTLSGAQTTIQSSGTATATYTAGSTPGAGSAIATVDSATATANITVSAPPDSTPPDTTITSTPSNPSNSGSPSFNFSGTDNQTPPASLTFECQLDGGSFTACTSPQSYSGLSDGSHTFQVRAVDAATNADPTPASYTWTIETVPPDTTLDSTPSNPSNSSSAGFSFSGTDSGSGVAGFECQLDGGSFSACTSPQSYSNLSDGSHTFQVRAVDAAGNVDPTPASFTWNIDTTGPDTLIVSHPPVTSNSSSATFSFTGNDGSSGTGVASFECKLDGGSFSACASPQSYSGLSDGSHTFQVRAIDILGNVDASPDSFTWTIDTTPPDTTIDSSPSNPSNSSTATFSFSGTDTGGTGVIGFACQIDGGGFSACTSPRTYVGLSDGSHTFQVRAVDVLVNIDPTPASFTWTIDTIAPGVTVNQASGQADPTTASPIHFTVVFNEAVTGFTSSDVSLSGTAGATTALVTETAPNDGTTFDVAVSGMTTNGTVIASIAANKASDAAGNGNTASTSTDSTVTFIFDNTPPDTTIDSSPSNPTGSTSASFSFSGTDNPGGTGVASFECKLDSGSFAACTSPKTYSSLSLGSHTFQVRAIDGIGNIDPTPASFTWEIHATTSLLYNGVQIVNVGNSFQPAAKLSSPASACVSGKTISFTLDRNPSTGAAGLYLLGTAITNSSGQATMSAVSTTGWQEGIYDLNAIFAGTSSCDPSSDEATLTVASPGNAATGGGWYTLSGSGRVNFGFTVRKTDNKCTSNCAYRGQLLLVNNGKWRLKGTLTTYSKLSTGQGAASGTGDLYWWDSSLNGGLGDWALAQSGVNFTINFFDSGKSGKSSTDAFGIKIQYTPVSPLPNNLPNSSSTQLKGGDIKVQ